MFNDRVLHIWQKNYIKDFLMNRFKISRVVGLLGLLLAQTEIYAAMLKTEDIKNEPKSLWQRYGWYVKMGAYTVVVAGIASYVTAHVRDPFGRLITSVMPYEDFARMAKRGILQGPARTFKETGWQAEGTHVELDVNVFRTRGLENMNAEMAAS